MAAINQKEYLKKYLGIGKKGDKKKKKKRESTTQSKFKIIDDDIDYSIQNEIKEDLEAENEDAPQIVDIIDDRPPSLRIDEVTKRKLWQPIGQSTEETTVESSQFGGFKLSLGGKNRDSSPPRRRKNDTSPPPRIKIEKEDKDGDISPPRRRKIEKDSSPVRKRRNDDISPPRREKIKTEKDSSPIRRRRNDSDDNSPPRKSRKQSPSRRDRSRNEDNSPPRRKTHRVDEDNLPPRRKSRVESPPRKSRWEDNSPPRPKKSEKTLEGKKAGLQNASDLAKETAQLKKKQDEMFRNLSAEVSGVNAKTVVRGRHKANEKDPEQLALEKLKELENKKKYDRWGRGLKQVDDYNEKIQQDLHEMSKPLARYANDEDLERYLKEQEREGDPMLAYIKKKKQEKIIKSGEAVKPTYQGEFMPNRFGIRPGYRWDGVDRSNGYEKKWFDIQNSRKASIEESYKWSTEDM